MNSREKKYRANYRNCVTFICLLFKFRNFFSLIYKFMSNNDLDDKSFNFQLNYCTIIIIFFFIFQQLSIYTFAKFQLQN